MGRGNDPTDPLVPTDFGVGVARTDRGGHAVAFRFTVRTAADPTDEALHFVAHPSQARHVAQQLVAAATDAEGGAVAPAPAAADGRSPERPLLVTGVDGSAIRLPGVRRPLAGVRVLASEFYTGTDAIARGRDPDGHWVHFALTPGAARRWSDALRRAADDAEAQGRALGLPPAE